MTGIKICFVAHNAYAAIAGGALDHVGGTERQQAMMARWLADQGHEVTVIVWGREDDPEQMVDGVRIRFLCKKSDGYPVLRFITPRWSSLVTAMREADADIYYYNLGDLGLGQMVSWCKKHGKASVYSVSSDSVCGPNLEAVLNVRERVLYRYGVRHVDQIVVQTSMQSQLLQEYLGRDSRVLPMPCADLGESSQLASAPDAMISARVLWVGRLSAEKRPHWVLDIAERCPALEFDVVGHANRATEFSRTFLDRADGLDNVTLRGVVTHDQIASFYSRASALLCTSEFEGFPNVFLEAWSLGLPVVSTFDPDGLIERHGLGFVRDDVEGLSESLIEISCDSGLWQQASGKARDYFVSHHKVDEAMGGFLTVFDELSERRVAANGTPLDRPA